MLAAGWLVISLFVVLMVLWVLAQIVRQEGGCPGPLAAGRPGRPVARSTCWRASPHRRGPGRLVTVCLGRPHIAGFGVTAQSIIDAERARPGLRDRPWARESGPGPRARRPTGRHGGSAPGPGRPALDSDSDLDADSHAGVVRSPTGSRLRPLPSTSTGPPRPPRPAPGPCRRPCSARTNCLDRLVVIARSGDDPPASATRRTRRSGRSTSRTLCPGPSESVLITSWPSRSWRSPRRPSSC